MSRPARFRLTAVAAAMTAVALCAAPAAASGGRAAAPGATSPQVSIAITSVNPPIAKPGARVTVSGTVANTTDSAMAGLSVQLWSSSVRLLSRTAMQSYLMAPGASEVDSPTRAVVPVATVPAHATRPWSLTLRVSQVGMTAFGVYPLAAELSQGAAQLDAARTFLPFWPGNSELKTLKPVRIAWVWPLIDSPHRAACPALLNDHLAASISGSGRLNQLLAVGRTPTARQARLTWAIDPALLGDVQVMTRRYQVGGRATCGGAAARPASAAARTWLAAVQGVTARQDFFVTPYADADVAALAHRGLDTELKYAFLDGQAQAQPILGRAQRTTPAASGMGIIAWPAGGLADYGVLETLAADQVGTVILDSRMMPPSPPVAYTPSAVTTTPDGIGAQLNVLLADDTIEQILSLPSGRVPDTAPTTGQPQSSAAPIASDPRTAAFAREQWFLAETAMIAAEAPPTARALVVAPPRRWAPGAGVATALLADSVTAPWLRPASLASLVTARHATGRVGRQSPPMHRVSPDELSRPLLRQVRRLDSQIRLLGNIMVQPSQRYLSTAVAAVASSAWRGGRDGQRAAEALLRRVADYVSAQQHQVRIVDTLRVTLGGKSGLVPVSISNNLQQPVKVILRVGVPSGDRVQIGQFAGPVTVDKRTQKTIKIPVRAAVAGSTTLTLWLTTPGGRLLPGSITHLTVETTHFGTLAIVIIGIALVVFVLTAAGRAFRRGGGQDGEDAGGGEDTQDGDLTGPVPVYPASRTGSVGAERADESQAAKEPDEHASTPGRVDRR